MTAIAIEAARQFAADLLVEQGKRSDAAIVRNGGGDDFAEVRLALLIRKAVEADVRRYARALDAYADADFWDAECPEASLAYHDRGAIARSALEGRELFQLHRD